MQRELVEAARDGDHEAFEVLAATAVDRLYAIARFILRDTHDAEDAVQSALTDAWRNLHKIRDPDRFDAWLHRLLVNACADERRHRRRFEAHIALSTPNRPRPTVVPPSPTANNSSAASVD